MEEGRSLYPARQVPAATLAAAAACAAGAGSHTAVTDATTDAAAAGATHAAAATHAATATTTAHAAAGTAAAAATTPLGDCPTAVAAAAAAANMTLAEREVRLLPPHVRTFGTGLARYNTASVDTLDELVAVSPVQPTIGSVGASDEEDRLLAPQARQRREQQQQQQRQQQQRHVDAHSGNASDDDDDDAGEQRAATHHDNNNSEHDKKNDDKDDGRGDDDDDDDDDARSDTMSARAGAVTEFDLAAYAKEEPTRWMQKRIMRRMFSAFDVTQSGSLDAAALREFCAYIGHSDCPTATLEKLYGDLRDMHLNGITFDKFWDWWVAHPDKDMTHKTFSLASADFSVPFHQQQLKIKEVGEIFTPSYRVQYYFKDLETGYQRQVSPWHDVPLYVRDPVRTKPEKVPANRYNFICEIPKWTRAKFEIATGELYNPIKQDIKNGIPRFYKHGDMMWNYGAFPQTWESTEVAFGDEGVYGDNDPLDGVEIGMRQLLLGEIHPVRVLGVLGMIDDGQMDWKVICMSVNDPIAHFIRDIEDVPRFLPGCLDAVREWFRVYKICQGGVENKFAFDGEFKNKAFAMKVLKESHYMWENLRKIKKREKV